MANEKIETTQNIITPPVGDSEKEKDLLAALESIPEDNIMRIWSKMDESERRRELEDFRERWRERIDNIDENVKKIIIEKSKDIPVSVEKDIDGSRLIEFSIWGEIRKILDPKLEKYSEGFRPHSSKWYTDSINRLYDYNEVILYWMRWDDVEKWENKKLRDYVKEKKDKEWFDIATEEQIKKILSALWEKAKLDNENDQIAMFMYLTGIDWSYRLKDYSWGSRSILYCLSYLHTFSNDGNFKHSASLCLITCK